MIPELLSYSVSICWNSTGKHTGAPPPWVGKDMDKKKKTNLNYDFKNFIQ
jgi:hypothetical protein